MIKEIANIFCRYQADQNLVQGLFDSPFLYEAEALYENFEDRNIYDANSLRQYVTVILHEKITSANKPQISDEMLNELRYLLLT